MKGLRSPRCRGMEAPRKARAERVRSEKEKNLANFVVKKLSITSLPETYIAGDLPTEPPLSRAV